MTLRDHVAERVEEARKFGEYVAEQMEGIGFRIEYTMNGKRKSPVYTGQRSTTYPDVQIEQRDRRVKGKRETVMSIDDVHSLLRTHQANAKGAHQREMAKLCNHLTSAPVLRSATSG